MSATSLQLMLIVVPILWGITATVIALVLYRTGTAVVKLDSKDSGQRRSVVLGGSVAIAAVAFFGFQHGTPKWLMQLTPQGSVLVDGRGLSESQALSATIDDHLRDLSKCVALDNPKTCSKQVDDLIDNSTHLRASLAGLPVDR